MYKNIVITGTGSYIPSVVKPNHQFSNSTFYTAEGELIKEPVERTISKFNKITDIEERRYASEEMTCSTLGTYAAEIAIQDSGIDREELDYVIVAHNFGDVVKHTIQSDMVPALASRIKHHLKIKNPNCVAYDVLFGCPGWIEATIQAQAFIKAGMAKKCLVIGAEALSRVLDPFDRDSMIFADGAGASIVELKEEEQPRGILAHASQSFTFEEMEYLYLGKSNYPGSDDRIRYIKMQGRKIYEFALSKVPAAMKHCLDQASIEISKINKVLIHQANHKMDEAIIERFYKLAGSEDIPEKIMPMTIDKLGNSSVATIPTLLDLILKNNMEDHSIVSGDHLLFASVGAGMNINAFVYLR
jgi:3-oxoacyl-[acyl-carrier-protein] synthase-3